MRIFIFALRTSTGIKHVQVYARNYSAAKILMPLLTADYFSDSIFLSKETATASPDKWVIFQPDQTEDPTEEIY